MSDIDISGAAPVPTQGEPAKLKGLHRATPGQVGLGHRQVKMLRPICKICNPDDVEATPGWWESCTHDPYVGERGERVVEKTYDTLEDGTRIKTGETETVLLKPWPNYVPVPLTKRLSNGLAPDFKRLKFGYILPSELRSQAFPNGIANSCEGYECYSQDNLVKYSEGTFCQEAEAVVAYQDRIGRAVEVMNPEIRTDQFNEDRAKVVRSA